MFGHAPTTVRTNLLLGLLKSPSFEESTRRRLLILRDNRQRGGRHGRVRCRTRPDPSRNAERYAFPLHARCARRADPKIAFSFPSPHPFHTGTWAVRLRREPLGSLIAIPRTAPKHFCFSPATRNNIAVVACTTIILRYPIMPILLSKNFLTLSSLLYTMLSSHCATLIVRIFLGAKVGLIPSRTADLLTRKTGDEFGLCGIVMAVHRVYQPDPTPDDSSG